jgi:phosphatidylinositol alpha-1,6-mannosyltransferase
MADAFVMPNVPVAGDMEGFGLVALEASAAGMPVIASRLEGITEAVHHGGNGILVDPLDAPAFAEAILDVLDRAHGARKAIGATFAAYTHEQFSWDRTAARYAEAIADVISGRALVAMRRRVRNAA